MPLHSPPLSELEPKFSVNTVRSSNNSVEKEIANGIGSSLVYHGHCNTRCGLRSRGGSIRVAVKAAK